MTTTTCETYDVSNCLFTIDILLHDTILIDANGGEYVQNIFIARIDTIKNKSDDDFLPCRASLVPELGSFEVNNISNILHDTMQSTSSENFVFVVVGDGDQEFGVSVVHSRSKVIAIFECELIWIAGCSSVYCSLVNIQLPLSRLYISCV